jgi:DNA-binding MarR family transcriptional regulator
VKCGCIETYTHPDDARLTCLKLAKKGRAFVERMMKELHDVGMEERRRQATKVLNL